MMDIRLQVFKAVAERNSFSLAASDLHMTQSTVSQHIQNLEAQYGVKLFDRLHRRIALTAAGDQLYPYAVEIERLYQQADNAMKESTGKVSGRLHIGASLTIGEYLLPELLVAYRRLFPDVDMIMEIYNTEQILSLVVDGKVDAGFIEGPAEIPPVVNSLSCGSDELAIIAPPDFPLSRSHALSLEQIWDSRWVMREKTSGTRRAFEAELINRGYDPSLLNIVMELGSTQAIKEAVKAGLGLAAVSNLAVADDIARGDILSIRLTEGPMNRSFSMIYHRDKFRTYAADRFITFLSEQLPQC